MAATKTIAFINYKGGVAKTTSTCHVGCWLAGFKNKRVLLIDIDPQTNLTFLCAPIEKWEKRKSGVGTIATMYRRHLEGKPIDTKKYIWKTPIVVSGRHHPRIDLIPCDMDLLGEDIGVGRIAGTYSSMEMLRKSSDQFLIGYTEAAEKSCPYGCTTRTTLGARRARTNIQESSTNCWRNSDEEQEWFHQQEMDGFLGKLSEVVESLPSSDEKSRIDSDLRMLIDYLEGVRRQLELVPPVTR